MPSERSFRRVLAGLGGGALDTATCGYAADVARGDASLPVIVTADGEPAVSSTAAARALTHPALVGLLPVAALDGNCCTVPVLRPDRCSWSQRSPASAGVILGQRQVPDKRGENVVIADLLAPLDVAGLMFTLDTVHTSKRTARLITGR